MARLLYGGGRHVQVRGALVDRVSERIEYVENDSPAYSLYVHCARLVTERDVQELR